MQTGVSNSTRCPREETGMKAVFVVALLVGAAVPSAWGLGCIGPNGPVDWFAAIKFPSGTTYAYMDKTTGGWSSSTFDLATQSDPISATVMSLYDSTDAAYALWNDEPASGGTSSSSFGHTKGVVGTDASGGFWLVHSAPKWPSPVAQGYNGYPQGETIYGQSFLCISVDLDSMNDIGYQLTYMRPHVYSSNMPSSLEGSLSNLKDAIGGKYVKGVVSHTLPISSKAGFEFTSLVKTGEWGQDLYEGLVCPTFQINIAVESWMNGVGPLPSYCKGTSFLYNVVNIRQMSIMGNTWTETKDHSKWAVATTPGSIVTCIGGINRQEGQESRGGGTVCFKDQNVFNAFSQSVVKADSCSGRERSSGAFCLTPL